MPPLIDFLVSQYQLRGTFLIVSALQLNIVAFSLLFRPIREHAKIQARERTLTNSNGNGLSAKLLSMDKLDSNPNNESKSRFDRASSGSVFNRVRSSKILALAGQQDTELTRQVSFLRSTSMMCSVPDLREYAKSWNVPTDETPNRTTPMLLPRKHTLSESSDCAEPPANATNRSEIRRVNTSQRMNLARTVSIRRATNPNLSSLAEKEHDSCASLAPSEPVIHEEDEDSLLEEKPDLEKPDIGSKEQTTLLERGKSEELVDMVDSRHSLKDYTISSKHKSKFETVRKAIASCFDMEVIKTRKLLITSCSVSLMAVGAPHCLFYLHAYAESVNMDTSFITKLLSISSIIDLVARLSIGALADMNLIHTSYIYFIR